MTYAQVLQYLLKIEKITLKDPPVVPEKPSVNYDANARCAYHSGAPGHDTEKCYALKNKIQDLLDQKVIHFAPPPNVNQNPMPPHGSPTVSVVDNGEELNLVMDINLVTTSLPFVKE